MKQLILITGGARSGKSGYAQKLALELSPRPIYLATARIGDEEFAQRVQHHRAHRGTEWTTIEEEKYLSRHDLTGKTAVVDCVTLWCANFFFDLRPNFTGAEEAVCAQIAALARQEATLIFVSNEIGMGGTWPDPVQRAFTDMQGRINQYLAGLADRVVLMVSGLPVIIKSTPV